MKSKPVIVITAGDPCGIGPEIVLKALFYNSTEISQICTPIILAAQSILEQSIARLNLPIKMKRISNIDDIHTSDGRLSFLDIDAPPFEICWGKVCEIGGLHAFEYIKQAIYLATEKKINAVVTAPINKKSLQIAGIPYLDHTEIFTKLTNSSRTMTLFITGNLRIFFFTRHLALRDVADALNTDGLIQTARDCIFYLKKIGLNNPHLAVAALNPHGGDNGLFGREEIDIIEPAVSRARSGGLSIDGPIPADSVFQLAKEGVYDAVLSLYHDQGHIAAKTYDFYRTVSLTMGLPFLRTSVDHGTAFPIAGQNKASEISMVEAVKTAAAYYW